MRNPELLLAGVCVFVGLAATAPVAGQQSGGDGRQGGQGDRGVQVGVPAGRDGRAPEAARARGRGSGPAPRAAHGRALRGVGAKVTDKGLW